MGLNFPHRRETAIKAGDFTGETSRLAPSRWRVNRDNGTNVHYVTNRADLFTLILVYWCNFQGLVRINSGASVGWRDLTVTLNICQEGFLIALLRVIQTPTITPASVSRRRRNTGKVSSSYGPTDFYWQLDLAGFRWLSESLIPVRNVVLKWGKHTQLKLCTHMNRKK